MTDNTRSFRSVFGRRASLSGMTGILGRHIQFIFITSLKHIRVWLAVRASDHNCGDSVNEDGEPGHIGGTPACGLPATDENRRDHSCRPASVELLSAEVSEPYALDPPYWPTRSRVSRLTLEST